MLGFTARPHLPPASLLCRLLLPTALLQTQHYCLYAANNARIAAEEARRAGAYAPLADAEGAVYDSASSSSSITAVDGVDKRSSSGLHINSAA